MKSVVSESLHQHLQINLFSIFAKMFPMLPQPTEIRHGLKSRNKRVLHEDRTFYNMPYHLMVRNADLEFAAQSAGADTSKDHQIRRHTAYLITCTSAILLDSPSYTSNQLNRRKTTLNISFSRQSLQISLPFLIYAPQWLIVKSSKRKRVTSPCFWTITKLITRTGARYLEKMKCLAHWIPLLHARRMAKICSRLRTRAWTLWLQGSSKSQRKFSSGLVLQAEEECQLRLKAPPRSCHGGGL